MARIDPSGYDAGKKVKGCKRHIVVDTSGLMLAAEVLPADVQDRDAAPGLLMRTHRLFPGLRLTFADGGYAGPKLAAAPAGRNPLKLQIVKRSGSHKGFAVLPRRWVVERTFAWITRCRRLARYYEALAASAVAFVKPAMIRIMLRRLAKPAPAQ